MFCTDGRRVPTREWAHVKDGRIVDITSLVATDAPPKAGSGETIVNVTGAHARIGFLVDHKGNVTVAERRTGQIPAGQPAYVDGPAVPAECALSREISLATGGVRKPEDDEIKLLNSGDAPHGEADDKPQE